MADNRKQTQIEAALAAVKDAYKERHAEMRARNLQRQTQYQAALAADEQILKDMQEERNQIGQELESLRQEIKFSVWEYLEDIPQGELRDALLDRALAKTNVPALQLALAEADRRLAAQRNIVDSRRNTLNQTILEERIPEIWERAEAILPQWAALTEEMVAVAQLWPADVTYNMPECMPPIGRVALHLQHHLPMLKEALNSHVSKR